MATFTALCLGPFIRGRKERASKIQDKKPSLATPRADPTSSGDQDNPSVPPNPGTQIWGGQGIPEHGRTFAEPGPWAAPTVLQPHDNSAGTGVLLRPLGSPSQDTLDPLSQNPLTSGGVSWGSSPSITWCFLLGLGLGQPPRLTPRLRLGIYHSHPPELSSIM